ncbi:MAG TPA: hypothetical protein VFT20_04050 [Candidatus Limnocylindrales bacterium]|nr:hypothetical protein [Candidatus Limnocylindrales bacterium]
MTEARRRIAIVLIAAAVILGAAVAISVAARPGPTPSPSPATPGSDRPSTPAPGDATVRAYRTVTLLPGPPVEPPGRPLQSRLWTVDGGWWAAMIEPVTRETRIFALNEEGSAWVDTGVRLDERPGAMVDVLWSGDRLYVASGVPGRSTHDGVRLLRFSRDPTGRYLLDPNFPVPITERGVTAVSLARDGAGRLWAAFVQEGGVFVAHSIDDDAVWTPPEPVDGATPVGDRDVAGIVADGDSGVLLVWSDTPTRSIHAASRADRDGPERWSPAEVLFDDLPLADEPLGLATDGAGAVFVTVETAVADDPSADGGDPAIVLLVRDSAGAWRQALVARVGDRLGLPFTVVDPGAAEAYVLASSPRHGGSVHLKRSAVDRLEFPAGRGFTLIGDSTLPDIAYLSSTKQPVDLQSGFVVQGLDEETGVYWHAVIGPPDRSDLPTPSASAGPGRSASPTPAPSPEGAMPVFTDDFEPWPLNGPIGNGWRIRPADAVGTLVVVADAPDGNRSAQLVATGADPIRACKDFAPAASGVLTADVRINVDAIDAADAVITSLRDGGAEAASVRFGQGGTFVYYSGATRVRTAVPTRLGAWYRSTLAVHLQSGTYDWRLAADDGTELLKVDGVPFREAEATQVSEICVASSTGGGVLFDDVRLSRVP